MFVICGFTFSAFAQDLVVDADSVLGAFAQDKVIYADSILTTFAQDELVNVDSALIAKGLTIINDVPSESKKAKSVIESPIDYDAKDSIAVSMENGQQVVYLYKGGTFKYGTISLEADYIAVNFEKKEIFASGVQDTAGVLQGKPHFAEGSEEFDCESLRYNFVSGKGFVVNVVTEQQDGVVRSAKAKMINKDVYCMVDGKYSTCDAEHPHFYLNMTKGKVIKDKAIITGRSYLVLEDFPIYFPFLPYGFIPTLNKSYSSGVIIPSYGNLPSDGYYLQDGGFYWAASDYFDLKVTGDVYSSGRWNIDINTNFKKRYKFGGSFGFNYSRSVIGTKGIDFTSSPDFGIRFSLNQDAKANPSQTISGSVDFSSAGNSKRNEFTDYERVITNSKSSSLNYRKTFMNTPFSLSASMRISQKTSDSTLTMTLPSLNFNMKTIYPFKRKKSVGSKSFLKDFQLQYSAQFESSIRDVKQALLLTTPYSEWKKGIKHNIPITLPSFKLFKYINVVPSLSQSQRWYFNYIEKNWIDGYYIIDNQSGLQKWVDGHVEETLKDGFKINYDYGASLSSSTTLYGMYSMKNPNSRILGVRHKMNPTISFNYKPDFSEDRFGFYDMVQIDSLGNYQKYNIFQNALYGSSGAGESRSVSFGLDNNIEMKILNDKDTSSTEKYKKIAIFDNLSFRGSYNFMADEFKLSPIALNARTKIKGTSINISGTLDPYALDEKGKRIDKYKWNEANGIARLGRITNLSSGYNFNYSSDKLKKKLEAKNENTSGGDSTLVEDALPGIYAPFDMPWRISANYTVSYSNSNGKPKWNQYVGLNGGIDLTPKWKTTISSGFDLVAMKMARTQIGIVRNLHCWTMSFDFVPFGETKFYNFTLRANASMLQSLKVHRGNQPGGYY